MIKYFVYIASISLTIWVLSSFNRDQQQEILIQIEELGEMLFNDPILSIDSTISCSSCHIPEFAFADTITLSKGLHGKLTRRNTPSAMNMASREIFMWDGRASSLEEQMLLPLEHAHEMGFHRDSAVARLKRSETYGPLFRKAFGKEVTLELLQSSIAYFEKSLETSDTENDRFLNDKPNRITQDQLAGRELFFGKANCFTCHFSPDFTGDEFRNIGLFNSKDLDDGGRGEITGDSLDRGKFKVPGLRNVAITAPYMHNGMFATLEEVIEFYNDPDKVVHDAINRDPDIKKLNLTNVEKKQLEAFLHTLTDDRFINLNKKSSGVIYIE
jgi:cytochrome c peroxidase